MTPLPTSTPSALAARQLALEVLKHIQTGAYADVALHRALATNALSPQDRGLATELVYGAVRRQRTLDALIDRLGKKTAQQQPPVLRLVLHLGLYQLRYLTAVPPSAAVNTSVDLAKANGLGRLSGVVNGLLRQYDRVFSTADPGLLWTTDIDRTTALGITYSFPNWLVDQWQQQLGWEETEQLCAWFNRVPGLDLRVNRLRTTVADVQTAFEAAEIAVTPIPGLADGLSLTDHVGSLSALPGYDAGWWTVQDRSAQIVSYLVDPQPGQMVIDACAAPGGKTTHLAELMADTGTVWACDRTSSRLKKVTANSQRLGLSSIQTCLGDSRDLTQFNGQADRVLVDAPCSGLGTLHRHADARWRQTPESVMELAELQLALLTAAAAWVKPDGHLVYATCTLHPAENEAVVQAFLTHQVNWSIQPPGPGFPHSQFVTPEGWVQVWPHRSDMDGFFMVKLAPQ